MQVYITSIVGTTIHRTLASSGPGKEEKTVINREIVITACYVLLQSVMQSYGNLKDQDRIFTNLYGRHDWKLKGALSRVRR